MNDALLKALKRLRLSGLAQTLDVRLQEAAGHNLTHAEFLELILQDELAIREDRLLARRVRAADFREPKTLEDFDWQFNTTIKRKQVYDLGKRPTNPRAPLPAAQAGFGGRVRAPRPSVGRLGAPMLSGQFGLTQGHV